MDNNIVKTHHGYIIRDRDIEMARYKYYLEGSLDTLYDIGYHYQKYRNNELKPVRKQIRGKIKNLLDFVLVNFYESDDDYPSFLIKNFNERILLSYLDEEHCGDCIKYPCTCSRCYVERLIGCNTMPDNSPYFYENETSCEYQDPKNTLLKQESLGEEFQKVLDENYWDLITQSNNTDDSVDNM